MDHLQIRAALPERYGVYLVNRGKRQYLSEDEAVEVDLCEESSVTLLQNFEKATLQFKEHCAIMSIGFSCLFSPLVLGCPVDGSKPIAFQDSNRILHILMGSGSIGKGVFHPQSGIAGTGKGVIL